MFQFLCRFARYHVIVPQTAEDVFIPKIFLGHSVVVLMIFISEYS